MSQKNVGDESKDAMDARYIPWTVVMKFREIETPIMLQGKRVTSYRAPVITEYIDTLTGEILQATELRNDKELWQVMYASERCMQREFILNSLRPEVREFALFVLRFRNQRRGVTPGFEGLVKWYAELSGKRADNVRRYIHALTEAGIIAGESLLGPLFQIAGKSVAAGEHLCEDSNAYSRLVLMRLQQRGIESGIETDGEPGWLKFIVPSVETHSAEFPSSMPSHIRELITQYMQEHPEPQFA